MSKAQLTFVVFLLHQLAEAWGMSVPQTYARIQRVGVMDDYIISCYDVLHTLGSEYLVNDITELVKQREAKK